MIAFVMTHVDQFLRLFDGSESGFDNLVGRSDECHHSPIGRVTGIDIEQFDAIDLLNLVGDLFDDRHIAAFAKIWDAFD